MENLAIPILIAAVVALMAWSITSLITTLTNPDRRKLKERLLNEAQRRAPGSSQLPMSITRNTETLGASGLLVRWSPMESLHRAVVQAYPNMTVATFLCIAATCAFLLFMVVMFGTGNLMIGGVAFVLGAYFPFLMLGQKRNRRQRQIAMQLPEALDFLARIMQAGHSFSTGVQMMSEEVPDPLKGEFRRCYEQHSLGQPLEEAMKDMTKRIESTDFAFFVTAVLIQRQTGGDLSEVLRNISSMIRQRIRLSMHVKAKTAEGRFTGYILVAFPAIMFVLISTMNPEYAHNLTGTSVGQKMLGTAFALQVMGLWAIRKLTTVKV